jgi:signal transduction histidine kinase
MFRSVRLRLIAYVVGVLTLVLLAAGASVYLLLTRELDATVERELSARLPPTPNATYQLRLPPPGATPEPNPPPAVGDGPPAMATTGADTAIPIPSNHAAIAIFNEAPAEPEAPSNGVFMAEIWRGQVAAAVGTVPAGLPDRPALAAARLGHDDERTVRIGGTRYRLLTRALPDPLNDQPLLLQAGVSLATRDAEERSLLLALAGGGLFGVVLVAAGALFLTRRALEPLQLAFERQRGFVADASHELRTPLTLVRLEAEELAGRLDGHQAQPLLHQIDRAARLVESLMTLARLDQGVLPLEPEPVHAATQLEAAAAAARRLAAPHVSVDVDAPPSCWLMADRDRIYQVLLILIDNACRVTPAGGHIQLCAACDRDRVRITVADSGPGISAEHLPRIFDRFYRLDAARSRARGGAGLGLAIARELVLAQGGQIALESPPGAGAVVTIVLPAAPVPALLASEAPHPGLQA